MVLGDGGKLTIACCVRRDALRGARTDAASISAGAAVEELLRRSCAGVRRALDGAERAGTWLSVGPIRPGRRPPWSERGGFTVGNAAGEAHPILGEGISMAMQGAFLLCARLEAQRDALLSGAHQERTARLYERDWRRAFGAHPLGGAVRGARDAACGARAASGAEGVARAAHGGRESSAGRSRRAGHIAPTRAARERALASAAHVLRWRPLRRRTAEVAGEFMTTTFDAIRAIICATSSCRPSACSAIRCSRTSSSIRSRSRSSCSRSRTNSRSRRGTRSAVRDARRHRGLRRAADRGARHEAPRRREEHRRAGDSCGCCGDFSGRKAASFRRKGRCTTGKGALPGKRSRSARSGHGKPRKRTNGGAANNARPLARPVEAARAVKRPVRAVPSEMCRRRKQSQGASRLAAARALR